MIQMLFPALLIYLISSLNTRTLVHWSFFFALEIARKSTGTSLYPWKYALEILEDSGLLATKPVNFPMESNLRLSRDEGPLLSDPTSYRHLIGRLLYLTITRPDLVFSVQVLSQFMDKPRQPHLDAAHRVIWYIKMAPSQGLLFPASSDFKL